MSPQMQFQPGKPRSFTAARDFSLGKNGVSLRRGMTFEYDGAVLTIPGYAPIQMPELRGAIRQGWIVPADNFDEADDSAMRPVSANVQVRRADGGNPMDPQPRNSIQSSQVENEEREVTNVRSHASAVRTGNQSNYRTASKVDGRANLAAGRFVTQVEEQDAREIPGRSFRTPAKQETNLERTTPQAAISEANSVRIQPQQGLSRDEMLDRMDPEEAAQYAAEIEARRSAYVTEAETQPILAASTRTTVGRVHTAKTSQREGFTVNTHVGGGVETEDLAGLDTPSVNKVETIESEGIRFTTTNGPKKNGKPRLVAQPEKVVSIKGTEDARRKIAKALCPDFPDLYDFDDPERKKIARIQADFDDHPDVIRAIFAAEGDAMKARILQEYPDVFK